MIAETASPAASIDAKPASSVVDFLGPPQQPHRRLRDDRQRAFRADEDAEQIEARRIEHGAAEVHDLAVRQHGLDAQHVVDREAVLQAVRAAGVLGDVAADRADDLARRVGRVVAAERRDVLRDRQIRDARLDHGPQVGDVDLEDPVHPRQPDHDAVGDRQRAAGEAGAVAARDERHAVPAAEPDDGLHFRRRPGQDDRRRRHAQVHEAVGLVRQEIGRVLEQAARSDRAREIAQKGCVARF